MTTVITLSPTLWGPLNKISCSDTAATMTSYSLDSGGKLVAANIIVPKTGTIDKIWVNITSRVGTPPAYNIGIFTVDSISHATTTLFGGSAAESVTFAGTGGAWYTLSTPAAVVANDVVAAKIYAGGVAPDGSNYVGVCRHASGTAWSIYRLFHVSNYTGASWAQDPYFGGLGLQYNDGEILLPAVISHGTAIQSDTSPDEVGCLFTVPMTCTCIGAAWVSHHSNMGTVDATITLYAGSTPIATVSYDNSKDSLPLNNQAGREVIWDTPVVLSPGTTYRLTVTATTATYDILMTTWTLNDLISRYWFEEGLRWYLTERTNGGAWTDTTTKIAGMGLILSSVTLQ